MAGTGVGSRPARSAPQGEDATPRVQPGVFFEAPRGLPRGPHGLSRDEVRAAQRQRLLAAFTELLAEHGYAKLRICDLTKRAAVSNAAFYELFASKEDCACAAYERYVRVIVRMANEAGLSESATWRDYIQASIEGYLGALAADVVVARALQLELGCIGPRARERRRAAALWFAEERLATQEAMRGRDPLLVCRTLDCHLAAVLGLREIASYLLEGSARPDFARLTPELVDWTVSAWYAGARRPI
ncbi:MAG TPA: TetR/AcrR family transcriptional regulator [Solirubrobacteraceae bacterium]|jgi:AcrR family transcriptional regulator|nr:TetR/AcrR family transcriptional regulator [Solirubrobacteraceae bacterium]